MQGAIANLMSTVLFPNIRAKADDYLQRCEVSQLHKIYLHTYTT